MLRGPGHEFGGQDSRPAAVKNFLAYSLTRLGTDHVDIYRPARLDPAVPIEDTVGAIKEMIDAGYVRHVGLSEVDAATIRRAHAVHPIADLQIEYSLLSRGGGGGRPAHAAGAGHRPDRVRGPRPRPDLRALVRRPRRRSRRHPRLQPAVLERERRAQPRPGGGAAPGRRGEGLHGRAAGHRLGGRAGRPDIVPLVGARTRERLAEALPALELDLTADDLAEIEKAVPAGAARGDRYPSAFMSGLGVGN